MGKKKKLAQSGAANCCYLLAVSKLPAVRKVTAQWATFLLSLKFSTSSVPVVKQMSLKAAICGCSGGADTLKRSRADYCFEVQCLGAARMGPCACCSLKIPGLTAWLIVKTARRCKDDSANRVTKETATKILRLWIAQSSSSRPLLICRPLQIFQWRYGSIDEFNPAALSYFSWIAQFKMVVFSLWSVEYLLVTIDVFIESVNLLS